MLLAWRYVNRSGLLVCWILLIGPPRQLLVLSKISRVFLGMSLEWFQLRLYLLLGMRPPGLLWMIFGLLGVVMVRRVYSGLILRLVVPLRLGALPFWADVCYVCWWQGIWLVEVDVHCAQYFVNSSPPPVVLFRRRLKSVADVLKGIRDKGFTQSRWDVLLDYREAVCRHGPCGPFSSLDPWDRWIPPDLHGFYRWVFDSLELLNGFLKQVVSRRDVGIRKWTMWLREDLGSRPVCLAQA